MPTDGKKIKRPIVGGYLSVLIETQDALEAKTHSGAVGVDLGLKTFATLSTGEFIKGPKPHRALGKRLRRLNQSRARKTQGSANFSKAKTKLSKRHKRIADIRQDAVHKLSHRLATTFIVMGIEDLNVKGMGRNGHLARSVGDAGMRMFRTQMEYTSAMTGAFLYTHPRFAPRTKVCSGCGQIHEMPLGKDTLSCDCGLVIDRDLNAALILKTAASSAVAALWREWLWRCLGCVKPSSMKQEEKVRCERFNQTFQSGIQYLPGFGRSGTHLRSAPTD